MPLELTFLGTGTSAGIPMIGCNCRVCTSADPRDQRDRASVVVRYPRLGEAHTEATSGATSGAMPDRFTVLIDASPDIRRQAIRHDLNWLDALLLTHAHADHVLGLDDLRRFNAVMDRAIDLYTEDSVIASLEQMFHYIFQPHRNVNKTFIAQLLPMPIKPGAALTLGSATWLPIRLMHGRLPTLGFRVDWAGRSLAYCTDCSAIPPETLAQLQGLDVLILDGLRERHHPTHMTLDRACEFAQQIAANQTYLTHMAHDHSHEELLARLPDGVLPAYDGLTLALEAVNAV